MKVMQIKGWQLTLSPGKAEAEPRKYHRFEWDELDPSINCNTLAIQSRSMITTLDSRKDTKQRTEKTSERSSVDSWLLDSSIWSESITALLCYQIKPAKPSHQPSSFNKFLWSFLISAHFYLLLSFIYGEAMHHIFTSSIAGWYHMTPNLPMWFMSGDILQLILDELIKKEIELWGNIAIVQVLSWEGMKSSEIVYFYLFVMSAMIASSLLLPQCWEECFCK